MEKSYNKVIKAILLLPFLVLFTPLKVKSSDIGDFINENSRYIGCAGAFIAGAILSNDNALAIGVAGCAASVSTTYHLNKKISKIDSDRGLTEEQIQGMKDFYESRLREESRKYEVYKNVIRRAIAKRLDEQDKRIAQMRDERVEENEVSEPDIDRVTDDQVRAFIQRLREQADSNERGNE